MKVGDLVKFTTHPGFLGPGRTFLITAVLGGSLIVLCSFPENQVFRKEQLEVVSEV